MGRSIFQETNAETLYNESPRAIGSCNQSFLKEITDLQQALHRFMIKVVLKSLTFHYSCSKLPGWVVVGFTNCGRKRERKLLLLKTLSAVGENN